ncbi:hypothetical protein BFU36_09140 [Sulfolobus sp. A20]|nr:hypothetical protein BFU36_09140 [Sulfolobus sp. A20]TRM78140.1 hypothetical protein DJ528_05370 [Sulfolobus sp. B5]TRM78790.1 hypothetical protein DJ532_00450 [Sulfolobus sp. A20-N-F8]TRM80190.1 hypothetical protein DJ524_08435 [Sulfolobus sp. D5]TRM83529.1 hypothetical protein DJ531_05225 [Sulfolobus sp. A20-N-F6]TRM86378.1 hypothetical protein DJ521_05690 [Sulfolobus sp. E3]TRM88132.1 hypothetical protein DJ529_06270 [Sulfolobus sp. C3]TRM98772.1 hypothetical protein DJ530_10060 [Sulfo
MVPIINIPGVIAVYKLEGDKIIKIDGEDVNIDFNKLVSIIFENIRIGKEEAKELSFLEPLKGFAMILDNLGLVFIDGYIIFTDARATNWDMLIKNALRGVVIRNG